MRRTVDQAALAEAVALRLEGATQEVDTIQAVVGMELDRIHSRTVEVAILVSTLISSLSNSRIRVRTHFRVGAAATAMVDRKAKVRSNEIITGLLAVNERFYRASVAAQELAETHGGCFAVGTFWVCHSLKLIRLSLSLPVLRCCWPVEDGPQMPLVRSVISW